jgi:hypothetical protein
MPSASTAIRPASSSATASSLFRRARPVSVTLKNSRIMRTAGCGECGVPRWGRLLRLCLGLSAPLARRAPLCGGRFARGRAGRPSARASRHARIGSVSAHAGSSAGRPSHAAWPGAARSQAAAAVVALRGTASRAGGRRCLRAAAAGRAAASAARRGSARDAREEVAHRIALERARPRSSSNSSTPSAYRSHCARGGGAGELLGRHVGGRAA